MGDDEHGIDVEEDTDLDTAEDTTSSKDDPDEEVPEEAMPDQEPGDADEGREAEAAEQENPDAHRDEEPYMS